MSKRTHQDGDQPDEENWDNPDTGGAQTLNQQQQLQQLNAGQEVEDGAGPGAGAQGNPPTQAQQDLIDIDNVFITDLAQDTPEVRALKIYTRQMQKKMTCISH